MGCRRVHHYTRAHSLEGVDPRDVQPEYEFHASHVNTRPCSSFQPHVPEYFGREIISHVSRLLSSDSAKPLGVGTAPADAQCIPTRLALAGVVLANDPIPTENQRFVEWPKQGKRRSCNGLVWTRNLYWKACRCQSRAYEVQSVQSCHLRATVLPWTN